MTTSEPAVASVCRPFLAGRSRRHSGRLLVWAATAAAGLLLSACGGGGVGSSAPPTAPSVPGVSLSPTILTFSSQSTGTSSAAQTVTTNRSFTANGSSSTNVAPDDASGTMSLTAP